MRRRSAAALSAPVLLCALAALTAYLAVSPRAREGGGGAAPAPAGGIGAVRARDGAARASSREAFLADLEATSRGPDAGGSSASVTWSDGTGVVVAAEGVIAAYRDAGSFSLATSGYLDLQGNVWGALVRHEAGSVDIVVIAEGPDGAATVTVSRLTSRGEGV